MKFNVISNKWLTPHKLLYHYPILKDYQPEYIDFLLYITIQTPDDLVNLYTVLQKDITLCKDDGIDTIVILDNEKYD